jgi:pyruvyltransferase
MVKAWWAKMEGYPNFGDLLTEYILNKKGVQVEYVPKPKDANLIGCGSILDPVPDDFKGYIMGSGMMYDRNDKKFPRAKIISVRGKLTAKNCDILPDKLGDVGLLLGIGVAPVPKVFRLGIIPHYVDKQNQQVYEWSKVPGVKIIDVFSPIDQIISEVNMCSGICSSSLHGLIVADALKVPSRWVELSDKVNGKGFKFRDYYSCYDLQIQPSHYIGFVDELFNRPGIERIIKELDDNLNGFIKNKCLKK